jgi:non-canonical purine NTP pyrophosphatase (RdgB/HAM1 family)
MYNTCVIYYVTGNIAKVESANRRLLPFNVVLTQRKVDAITEPQGDDISKISLSKAQQAFKIVKQPLVVSDAGWYITALNGFPGAYMAYVNRWFTPRDFLNLMSGKPTREVVLDEVVTYIDATGYTSFDHKLTGKFLTEPQGEGLASDTVISLSTTGRSIAESKSQNLKSSDQAGVWENFGTWYTTSRTRVSNANGHITQVPNPL